MGTIRVRHKRRFVSCHTKVTIDENVPVELGRKPALRDTMDTDAGG